MIMKKISVYFRDDVEDWEMMNLTFQPAVFNVGVRLQLLQIGCNFQLFGNAEIARGIDEFMSNKDAEEYRFDATGAGRYYYIMRREED